MGHLGLHIEHPNRTVQSDAGAPEFESGKIEQKLSCKSNLAISSYKIAYESFFTNKRSQT